MDDSECAEGLECVDTVCTPIGETVCKIEGTLALPSGVDAAGNQYVLAIDSDTVVNLNEAALFTNEWSSADTHDYIIDVSSISSGDYFVYAAISVGGSNYIGYFGGSDIDPPAEANASLNCSSTFDIDLAENTALTPDYEIASTNFPADGIAGNTANGSFMITNSGQADGAGDIEWKIYLSENGALEPEGDTLLDEGSRSPLNVNATTSGIPFSFTWPSAGHDYRLFIYIAASDDGNPGNDIVISDGIDVAAPKRAIAVGSNGTILYSDDFGKTWSSTNSGTTSILRATAQSQNGRWVVVGYDGTALYSTNNGIGWSAANSQTTNRLNGIASFGADDFIAVGEPSNFDPYGITWSNPPGRLVAVGQMGKVIYGGSSGTNWTLANSGTDEILYDVASDGDGRFIAVGYDGTIIYSHNAGVTWTAANSGTGEILWDVAFSN